MNTIIVKSLVNANNTHAYPGEFVYSISTLENNLYKLMNLHYKNVVRSIGDVGGHVATTSNNVIVCCTTECDFVRPAKHDYEIHHNTIYSDKNYFSNHRHLTDFRNFYGGLATVLKFLAPFKMLVNSGNEKQMSNPDYHHAIDNFDRGRDVVWIDYAIKTPHLSIHNGLSFSTGGMENLNNA